MIAAGIDAGTQSIKVLVYDSDKHEIIALTSSPLPLIEEEGGVREQKASWWTDAVRKCFLAIPADIRKRIGVISVSGQQHGFVPVAADGSVLYSVKLWCDTSTAPECYEIEEKLGGRKALSEIIGNPILPGYTASKILWFRKNHPDLYEKMATVMLAFFVASWLLSSFDFSFRFCAAEESMLAHLCGGLKWLFAPIGMGDWRIAYAALSGLIAKENVAGTLELFFPVLPFGARSAFALAVFVLASSPCISALAAAARELGAGRALACAALQTGSALLLSYLVYFLTGGCVLVLPLLGIVLLVFFFGRTFRAGIHRKRGDLAPKLHRHP